MFSHCDNNEITSKNFLALLRGQGIATVCDVSQKTTIIEHLGEWWTVSDNGGELNIEKVNHPESLRSVGYESNLIEMDTMTMVYRVLRVLKGQEIDYRWCANYGEKIAAQGAQQ